MRHSIYLKIEWTFWNKSSDIFDKSDRFPYMFISTFQAKSTKSVEPSKRDLSIKHTQKTL